MLIGNLLIGNASVQGIGSQLRAFNPATAESLEPAYKSASLTQLDAACTLAQKAFDPFRTLAATARAAFLETIAENIRDIGDELIERAMAETGLPRARLEGERGRTIGQLQLFAKLLREGGAMGLRIDPALPDRKPLPRPDLRLRMVPLGPVAVFGASNFPLAFSVAGGDTASALAAGCPVIVKAHGAHPGVSELVGCAIQKAAAESGMPEGVFSLLFDAGIEIAQALVADHRIKAVGFTGSRQGGLALMAIAQTRKEPIPVYAEMSSINPIILFPHALNQRSPEIATGFAASLLMGAGQFCTGPGLVLALDGPDLDAFLQTAQDRLSAAPAATMLTTGVHGAYEKGVDALAAHGQVQIIVRGKAGAANQCVAALFKTTGAAFLENTELANEVFGSSSLVVACRDEAELVRILHSLEGQLTASMFLSKEDHDLARKLVPILELKVGRIIVNAFGTGVEVSHAMVHGGPFPATSNSQTTSVGTMAIDRFLRPVCYQDIPDELLPEELRDLNAVGYDRMLDGKMTPGSR